MKETIERKIYFCAESLAADYLTELQSGYGLYGLYGKEGDVRRNNAYEFLSVENSMSAEIINSVVFSQYSELAFFDYEIKDLSLFHMGNITEPAVLKENICSLMKYKVPADLLSELTEKLEMFGEGTEICSTETLYSQISEAQDEVVLLMDKLQIAVNGTAYSTAGSVLEWKDFGSKSVKTQIDIINGILPAVNSNSEIKQNIKTQFESLKNTVQVYKNYMNNALLYINDIKTLCDEIEVKKAELEKEISKMDFSVDINLAYYKNIKPELDGLDVFLKRASNSSALQKLQKNLSLLNDAETACNDVITILSDSSAVDTEIIAQKIQGIKKLDEISCEINIPEVNKPDGNNDFAGYDISDKKENSLLNVFSQTTDIVVPEKSISLLPSTEAGIQKDTDLSAIFDSFNNLNIENVGDFSGNSISETGNVFMGMLDTAAENVYVNEYIMSFFYSNSENVTEDRFFNAEIEYIIAGNANQNDNIEDVYKQILAIRTTMNFIHILLDSTKVNFANQIGNSIAASTMGIGAPLYAFAIMGIWATAEAAIDLIDLKEGESVPFYKMQGDWKLDLGLDNIGSAFLNELTDHQTEKNVTSGESIMNMTYKDYLNVLLLAVPMKTKLLRICDLLELNLSKSVTENFNISEVYTCISCDLTISVQPIINLNLFRKGGRGGKYEMRFIGNSIY